MNEQRIKEVFSDEVFVSRLLNLETAQEVRSELHSKGIDLSIEDIHKIRDTLINTTNWEELSEAQLEEVAGGILITTILSIIFGAIGAGCAVVNTAHTVSNGRW